MGITWVAEKVIFELQPFISSLIFKGIDPKAL
jgi:hypothetical protein